MKRDPGVALSVQATAAHDGVDAARRYDLVGGPGRGQASFAQPAACRRTGTQVPRLALVVFVDRADSRWLRGLRAGFRHCFVALCDGAAWLACDALKDRLELSILPISPEFDLAGFYAKRGHTVLLGTTRPNLPRRPLALTLLTCVTIAKRVLGVRAPWVVTPRQLCRHLQSDAHGFVTVAPPDRSALDSTG